MKTLLLLLFFVLTLLPPRAEARRRRVESAPSGTQEIKNAMKVQGQTRTLSMMLVLKNKKDEIKFINIRRDYRKEILNTKY